MVPASLGQPGVHWLLWASWDYIVRRWSKKKKVPALKNTDANLDLVIESEIPGETSGHEQVFLQDTCSACVLWSLFSSGTVASGAAFRGLLE